MIHILSVDPDGINNCCDLEIKKRNVGHAASFLFVVDADVPRIEASTSLKCVSFKKHNASPRNDVTSPRDMSPKENKKWGLYADKGRVAKVLPE